MLAALALLGAVVAGYAHDALFDSDEFAERATAALDDDAVRAEVAIRVTDDLVLNAQPDLVGGPAGDRGRGRRASSAAASSRACSEPAVRDVHRAVFEQDANTATLTLADIGEVLRGALEALRPQLAEQIPARAPTSRSPRSSRPAWLADLAQVADDVDAARPDPARARRCCSRSPRCWLSPDRRRTVLALGVALAICGVVGRGRRSSVGAGARRSRGSTRPGDARRGRRRSGTPSSATCARRCYLFAALRGGDRRRGLVAAAPGRHRRAAAPRLRPDRHASPSAADARCCAALALIVAGILIVVRRDAFVDLVVILARPLRRLRRRLGADAADDPARPRRPSASRRRAAGARALVATAVAAGRDPGRRRASSSASAGPSEAPAGDRDGGLQRQRGALRPAARPRSPSRRPTTRCRRRRTRAGCSPSRTPASPTSSATASAALLIDAHYGHADRGRRQ